LALPLIHFVSRSNYNLFHSFADGASIVIAASTFTIIWNSRRRVNNDYFLFTGIAFLSFSLLDAMHLLGNKNMGIFPAYGNLGPTFYIASRYLLSVSLLCAPLFIHRKLKAPVVLGGYALVCALVVLSVFYWEVFPVCLVEGVGLTPFKVVSDYIICLILAGSIVLLLRHRESFDPRVLRIIVSSIVLSIATGLTFTLYTDPFGITNMMGHLFQLASFYMVYVAFIETSLTKPHEILFRELKQNEEKLIQNLRKLDDANIELNQEIAERKLAEEGLRQNREWLRVTLSSIGDAVVAADTEGRVTFLNPVAEEITGWELEEAIGTPVRNVFRTIDEETRLPGEDIVERVLREGCIVNLANNTALIARDGREIPIEDSAAPIWDSFGTLIGVVLVFHDVTEKRKAQDALRESEAKYRTLFENMAEEVHFWQLLRGDDGRIKTWRLVDANPPTLKTWGRTSSEEIRGKTTDEIFGSGATDHYMPVVEKIMAEGAPYSFEDYFPNLNKYFRFTSVPLGDYFITTGADITGLKKVEEELRKSRDELEIRVQERTAELQVSNKALVEYAAKLERVNEELQDFAFVAAHDLQEPLRKIQTFCDLAMTRCTPVLDGTGLEYLERVVSSATRMRQLLHDLLQFSMIAAGPEPFKTVELGRIAREAADLFEEDLKESGGLIEIENLPPIEADGDQMLRLFQNIIGNALKYQSVESPRIKIHAKHDARECEILVEDNGIGFEQQFAERIFKPFQRLHGRKEYVGTGMGLAICRKIVDWHGGNIRAASEAGRGSTFIISLPMRRDRREYRDN
jgi:PAS domain S-box-containing protein